MRDIRVGTAGIEIANRWMMGWPKIVVNLLIEDMPEEASCGLLGQCLLAWPCHSHFL